MTECDSSLESRAGDLLAELVRCPSVNPGAGREVDDSGLFGESRYAELLAEKAKALGAEVRLDTFQTGRVNVAATFPGADRSRSLAFEAHGDTVSHEGMTVDPFAAEIIDGRLYGRGACDNKGSMAAMLLAIEDVLAAGQRPPVDIHIVSTGDEEIGGTGVRHLLSSGFRAGAVIVGEPTNLELVHASKGSMRFYLETFGKAAHSSNPSAGINAIDHMAAVITGIQTDMFPMLAGRCDALLGEPTISVGVIAGGSQVNVVPERCRLEIDRRLIPGESVEQAVEEIRSLLERLAGSRKDFSYNLRFRSAYPPFSNSTVSSLVTATADACRRSLGSAKLKVVPWAATAGVFADSGIPAVIIGPGDIAQAHTAEEYVELDQVARAARLYGEMMRCADAIVGPRSQGE